MPQLAPKPIKHFRETGLLVVERRADGTGVVEGNGNQLGAAGVDGIGLFVREDAPVEVAADLDVETAVVSCAGYLEADQVDFALGDGVAEGGFLDGDAGDCGVEGEVWV